ncbi:MAG TPA: ricin-type beta-trefoil lectin domain protein [Steroidobacteraceae bacterium]|nr:ricin-type beta-trefoil lectin domain protein [Steroidobacteraceae bacterium]
MEFRWRTVLARGSAALLSAGLALGGTAAASASTHAPAAGAPGATVINLTQARAAATPHVKHGKIAGIMFPTTKKLHKTAAVGCTEPDCNLLDNGGSVQHSPHVYLLFWGPNWSSEGASATYLEHLFQGLGVQTQDSWSTTTDQYTDSSGHPFFSGSVYMGAFSDTSTPPTGVGQSQFAAEADAFASTQGITDLTNAQIVIATQSGTCPQGFYAPTCNGGNGTYCAWHSNSNEPYTNLPYLLDAGTGCGENFVNSGSAGTNDGFSIVEGHEYAETITDPFPDSGWFDGNDTVSGGEIGDKCAWGGSQWGDSDPIGNVTLSSGTFAMQSLWSNAKTGCVMSTPQSTDTVTVTSPGNRKNVAGGKYSLAIKGTSSGGHPLAWSATGLPAGMTISASTGVISGKFSTAATYTTKVTAKDTAGASGSATFTWKVSAATGSPIKGFNSMCLDDAGAWETVGNPVDLYTCNGTAAQKWSYSSSELHVFGLCLSDTGGSGSKVSITNCKGAATETWTHPSNGEYVLKSNGLCLTDPGSSKTAGTVQVIRACRATANQKWSGT